MKYDDLKQTILDMNASPVLVERYFDSDIWNPLFEARKKKVAELKKRVELSKFLVYTDKIDENEPAIELKKLYKIIKEVFE